MKRITLLTVLLACGLLATSAPIYAQSATAPEASNWFTGKATLLLLGRDNVDSSKFQEYREVPKGVSMPVFSLMGSNNGKDFALMGSNISKSDQRYTGWANFKWVGLTFDYNQIPHNMGNNGQTLYTETAPGVWSMSSTLRKSLGDTIEATPNAGRNYPFYVNLLTPTLAATNSVDISGLREHGELAVDLGKNTPFDLKFTYMRELKSGSRGASGGTIYGQFTGGSVNPTIDVPEVMDELTQDFGLRFAYAFKAGDVHASFNRNIYNDRVNALIVDNPFRYTDVAYPGSTASPSGSAQARWSTSPDNEANRTAFGTLLKFKKQTRIFADVAIGQWTQNQAFLPFTTNAALLTPAGVPANSVAALPQASLDGKFDTTMLNFAFSSRPADALGVRLRYRTYEYKDKTNRFFIPGDTATSPELGRWFPNTADAEDPYGHATANKTDASTKRFDAQVSYDVKDLTLEGAFRNLKSEYVGRQASSGTDNDENAYTLAAVYHSTEYVSFRASFDQANRTVGGIEAGTIGATTGIMADHAERKSTRTGVDVELTPSDKFGVTFAYFRRNDDFPNRPNESAADPDSKSGLLEWKYDTYTIQADFTPNEKAEVGAFYTYEKNAQTNQWLTLVSGTTNVNNKLNYAGSDKGNTFGANAVIHFVPEKWTFTFWVTHQKIDGLMDVTANSSGAAGCCSFFNGRTTLSPPGPQNIDDLDDTEYTTAVVDLAYMMGKSLTFSVGYAYEDYSIKDAYSDGTTLFPQSVLFFMKQNDGGYTVNIGYTKLTYRF